MKLVSPQTKTLEACVQTKTLEARVQNKHWKLVSQKQNIEACVKNKQKHWKLVPRTPKQQIHGQLVSQNNKKHWKLVPQNKNKNIGSWCPKKTNIGSVSPKQTKTLEACAPPKTINVGSLCLNKHWKFAFPKKH
jgi:hypothetical protein